jgi:hypothetical protein
MHQQTLWSLYCSCPLDAIVKEKGFLSCWGGEGHPSRDAVAKFVSEEKALEITEEF